ncbi:exopolyphosphatase [Mycena alexandri]|uniref:Exopolyphosphatase n=1 Tax=Mycena alexandri TaxID=1745969 RepID=A0AAD6SPN8_9AGAR|nr:exopolyphosphatase [Mycena alexandri]
MSTFKPNALRRLSTVLSIGKAPMPAPAGVSTLASFLSKAKEDYLSDIRATPSKGGKWTVVMGNEAGDLDSVASSIAFAWVHSEIQKKPCIPLIQIARDDLNLRAENLYALNLAGIDKPHEQLLSTTDLDGIQPFPSNTFALVDHNRLAPSFSAGNKNPTVVAVIDHHEDEDLYKSAFPRQIEPAGSCSSHMANIYPTESEMPKELADLLLCAILVDTNGLITEGKARPVDYNAAASLIPRSSLRDTIHATALSSLSKDSHALFSLIPEVKQLSDTLDAKKSDVSHLGAWDLLRRDYKEYTFTLRWHPSAPSIKAGLATVPVKLKAWGSGGRLEDAAQRWMAHRKLSVLGVLTSFRDNSWGKRGNGKHRREMAWFVRDGTEAQTLPLDEVAARLWAGVEANREVKVTRHKKMELAGVPSSVRARAYKQGNASATRKVTAPLLRYIMEAEADPEPQTEEVPTPADTAATSRAGESS